MRMNRYYRRGYYDRLPANTKLVCRPSRWGNPFSVSEHGINRSLRRYYEHLTAKLKADPDFLKPLIGFDLACYCRLDEACHGDILLDALEGLELFNS